TALDAPCQQPASLLDDADALQTWRAGQGGLVAVLPADHEQVERVDRAGEHAHAHLARAAHRGRDVAHLQHVLRLPPARADDRPHSTTLICSSFVTSICGVSRNSVTVPFTWTFLPSKCLRTSLIFASFSSFASALRSRTMVRFRSLRKSFS